MKQFILPQAPDAFGRVDITGEKFHYLAHVRRLGIGERIQGRDRGGHPYDLVVEQIDNDRLRLRVVGLRENRTLTASRAEEAESGPSEPAITLAVGLPKGRIFDQVVRQATEGGVARITPLLTEHTIAQAPTARRESKFDRWQRIAEEAAQQSGTSTLPTIDPPVPLKDLLSDVGTAAIVAFHEQPIASPKLRQLLARRPKELLLLVGPEGGLSDAEIDLVRETGAVICNLGPNVLRVETAAVYAVATVRALLRLSEIERRPAGDNRCPNRQYPAG